MGVIGDLSVPTSDVRLNLSKGSPGEPLRLANVIPSDGGAVVYVWADYETVATATSYVRTNADVSDIQEVDALAEQRLLRVEMAADSEGVLARLNEADVAVLEGVGTANDWTFRLRFPTRSELRSFRRACSDDGIGMTVHRLYAPEARGSDRRSDLTPEQLEALRTAYERGYFEVPRDVSLVELSETLGVSDSAVSQRLRRGVDSIVEPLWSETLDDTLDDAVLDEPGPRR